MNTAIFLPTAHMTVNQVRFMESIHTWLVRFSGHTILIDTGVGNGKNLPATPQFHQLNLPYLDRLLAAGVQTRGSRFCAHNSPPRSIMSGGILVRSMGAGYRPSQTPSMSSPVSNNGTTRVYAVMSRRPIYRHRTGRTGTAAREQVCTTRASSPSSTPD